MTSPLTTFAIQRRCQYDWRLITVTQARTAAEAVKQFAYLREKLRAVTFPALAKLDFYDTIDAQRIAREKGFIQ